MKPGTTELIKFKKLKKHLNLNKWQCVGLLESIWIFTAKNHCDGSIGRSDNLSIACAIDWEGNEDDLINELVECRWIDRCKINRLIIHDWHEHAPPHIKGVMSRHGRKFPIPIKGEFHGFEDQVKRVPYPDNWEEIRLSILCRDGYICQYCGKDANQIDHLIQRVDGGDHNPENLVACCARCNSSVIGLSLDAKIEKISFNKQNLIYCWGVE